jgi:hypothetical protein
MKILLSALLLIIICLCSFKVNNVAVDKDVIIWDKDVKLTWDDFKAKAPKTTTLGATTDAGIMLNTVSSSPDVEISIKSIFKKSKSWVKTKTDLLLNHEQLHFDISELFARKTRKIFAEKKFNKKSLSNEMTALFKSQMLKLEAYQSKYDKETDHSRKSDKQTLWEKNVLKDIKDLDSVKDTTVVLTVK